MKLKIGLAIVGLICTFSLYVYQVYKNLPNVENINSCFTTTMFKVHLCPGKRGYVRFKSVPKDLINALIMSEDASFFSHKGADWYEIQKSMEKNIKKGRWARGGSTITQQLAKNLYLTPEKTIFRKIKEFLLARQIEDKLNKYMILEKYVNVVEFGPKIYGITKAASHYFGKQVDGLNLLESVYLISLLPQPRVLSLSHGQGKLSNSNKRKMTTILRRMKNSRRIDEETFEIAKDLLDAHPWPFDLPLIPSIFQQAEEEFENRALEADIEETQQEMKDNFSENDDFERIENSSIDGFKGKTLEENDTEKSRADFESVNSKDVGEDLSGVSEGGVLGQDPNEPELKSTEEQGL